MFNHANQLFKIKFVDGISKVERIKWILLLIIVRIGSIG